MTVEHAGGHLTAACEFRPVAGVGGRRHDFRFHGGRGHAGEQHRRFAGQFGECGAYLVSGGGVDDAWCEAGPVLGALRQGFQRGKRATIGHGGGFHHADASALGNGGEQLADSGSRAKVQHPRALGSVDFMSARTRAAQSTWLSSTSAASSRAWSALIPQDSAHETACETASAISGLWNGRVTSR